MTLYLECLETLASKLAGIIFPIPNNSFWKLLVYSNPGVEARLVTIMFIPLDRQVLGIQIS
jgi:hypothetical protein